MAGFRQTLRKLAKKYGVDIKGATYTQVVQAIVKDNVARASKKMGDLSNRRMKTAFEEGIKDGIIDLPEYAVPLVTMRKAAEDGKMITDTLRDTLTRGLRKSIVDNPNNTEKAIEQMQQSVKDIMTTYTTSHAKTIAVTEVRSSVDLSKYEYVRELLARNPNRLRVVKRWIHHDHLVKVPRPTHKAIDGEQVLFNQPFSIGLMYPHDPNAPASEVIGCQCGYRIEIEEMATNEIFKALKMNIARLGEVRKASASINPATGKPYQIGETKTRPDGTKWVKTGTFSWAKAGTKDAEEAKKKTDPDGDGKKEKKELEGQSSKDVEDILGVYGEKGLYQLTKVGMYNLLLAHGVDDPKALSWQEKVAKVKEISKEIEEGGHNVEIKTQGKEEFTEEDLHILHNTDLVGDVSRLDNSEIYTRNGDVTLKYTEDGLLTDECYDDLMKKVDPIRGGHWGSAETSNITALSVALVNAPDWKPIDRMKNGQLAKYDQQLSDGMYKRCLVEGIGLRKYAQEKLKHPDMSREKVPYFYRGMTVDAVQYEQLLAGEADTIELTGCTAVTSFEEVADQYASSQWTRSFGAGRRSIKLVIERDDYMDNSIGMFHHNTKGYAHGNQNIGFELLTGSPSFYVKSVGESGSKFDPASIHEDNLRDEDKLREQYDEYKQRFEQTNNAFAFDAMQRYAAAIRMLGFNEQVRDWFEKYDQEHLPALFSKIKNKDMYHANNNETTRNWNDARWSAFNSTDLGKKYEEYRKARSDVPAYYDYRNDIQGLKKLASTEAAQKGYEGDNLYFPRRVYDFNSDYQKWRTYEDAKRKPMTMKMWLDKQKPLEKSYKTQVDKTAQEYKEFEDYYKWRNSELLNVDRMQDVEDKWIRDLLKKHNLQETDLGYNTIRTRENGKKIIYPYGVPYKEPTGISSDDWVKIRREFYNIREAKPVPTQDGIDISAYNIKDEDNPYLTPEIIKNPMWQKAKNDEYTFRRYSQLQNMRTNYENAKRENDLVAKYDIYNTPQSEIQKKYDESQNRYNDIIDKIKDYTVTAYAKKISPSVQMTDADISHFKQTFDYNPSEGFRKFRDEEVKQDKGYQKLIKQKEEEGALNGELAYAMSIYRKYENMIRDSHKNARPLVVHVVCGRGKKSITTGANDELEEKQDD